MIAAIVAAAGSGERFGASIPKALINLGDRTLLEHAISSLSAVADQIVVTAPAGFEDQIRALVGSDVTVVTGGATRSDSVRAGLAAISGADFVLVHDAARALATRELAASVVAALMGGDVVHPQPHHIFKRHTETDLLHDAGRACLELHRRVIPRHSLARDLADHVTAAQKRVHLGLTFGPDIDRA